MKGTVPNDETPEPAGAAAVGDQLHDLARRVRKLSPSRHDPEYFHVEKDAVAHELNKLARRIGEAR